MPAYPGALEGDRPVGLIGAEQPAPAVLLLGGYSWMSWELEQWMGLADRVDGFTLVVPSATLDKKNRPFWNATDTCCDWYDSGVDDLGYLRGVMDAVPATDWTVIGHSNGAFMGFALACNDPRVSTVVSIGGSEYLDGSLCPERRPIRILQVHGDQDDIMPMAGDKTAPGVDELFERWACTDERCTLWTLPGEDHYPDFTGELTPRILDWVYPTP
jgi:polyhydroxybutyrate depolymerase